MASTLNTRCFAFARESAATVPSSFSKGGGVCPGADEVLNEEEYDIMLGLAASGEGDEYRQQLRECIKSVVVERRRADEALAAALLLRAALDGEDAERIIKAAWEELVRGQAPPEFSAACDSGQTSPL